MLKYEVRLGNNSFRKDKIEWSEKYLSQDLSVVTGVTTPSYHLDKFSKIEATNSIINSDGILDVECKNVQRQGFIVVLGKRYYVKSGVTYNYSMAEQPSITYHYITINGKYFYWQRIDGDNGYYAIDNLLTLEENNDKYEISNNIYIPCAEDVEYVEIDTLYWIEDGKVTIDGTEYIYDRNEGESGILKYSFDGRPLDIEEITECSGVNFYPYDTPSDYEDVTKFKLTKQDEVSKDYSRITFLKYGFYVKYKDHYCRVKKNIHDNEYKFVCEIPKHVLDGTTDAEFQENVEFDLYFTTESNPELIKESYMNGDVVDSANYDKHKVKNLDELSTILSFIYIEEEDSFFTVDRDILTANDGDKIAVYVEDEHMPLKIGDKIKFIDNNSGNNFSIVYDSSVYDGESNDIYVVYDGKKYKVFPNLVDKAIINGHEYSIEYPNGKTAGYDCIVDISGEKVPMKIVNDAPSGGRIEKYGKIVIIGDNKASVAQYDIKTYSGITINNVAHSIYITSDGEVKYADISMPSRHSFNIDEIHGSSMYICSPDINKSEFTEDFRRHVSNLICKDVVDNQRRYNLFIQNKIFGENEITSDLPFRVTSTPLSSDDYYNLFESLSLYVNNSYINVPIRLATSISNNTNQSDIINGNFFEAEKERTINKIVDMEKDVYVPKYIENGDGVQSGNKNKYIGSRTTFKPIKSINLNFHFRTRNLSSWKVNDGYNNAAYASDASDSMNGNDNWFITDFYPYREILRNRNVPVGKDDEGRLSGKTWEERANVLQETSDLMGLLYFTNDDIFYQRSKVAKSFARLSFYDSTDPQTQSLLATSCIFVDEHKLFKTFIDNSRKNTYEYGMVVEPEYQKNDNGFISPSINKVDETTLNKYGKISVSTEFLGRKLIDTPYSSVTNDSCNIIIDENRRISSRLVVNNKYETDTSSEGFYIYLFKEYSENLHPKPIYMKIEFNHAGIGKTIPFLIPMHWSGQTSDNTALNYNKMYPEHALKLSGQTVHNSITNMTDIEELKKGIPLSYTYAQTYIPIYAVYDFNNKEFCYVFDSRYAEQDCNGNLNLNLFEMKIMDESNEVLTNQRGELTPEAQKELNDIKLGRQRRAIININEEQFDKKYFNQVTE